MKEKWQIDPTSCLSQNKIHNIKTAPIISYIYKSIKIQFAQLTAAAGGQKHTQGSCRLQSKLP